ncbi:MAG: type IX secretion system membrane protein PorP/SprF [Bacteroidales bacterium]|nr:type IX secretion system membrane protein PorP/SprF [Bacteroidales bacterium]
MRKFFFVIALLISSLFAHPSDSTKARKTLINLQEYPFIFGFNNNPSFAGLSENHKIKLFGQYKWVNYGNCPYNYDVSYDQTIGKKKMFGVGASYFHSWFNYDVLTTVEVAVSVKFKFGKNTILRIGITPLSFNYHPKPDRTYSIYPDMISPKYGVINGPYEYESKGIKTDEKYFDSKAGISFENENFFCSVSALHIKEYYPKSVDSVFWYNKKVKPVPFEIQVINGYILKLNSNFTFTPLFTIRKNYYLLSYSPALYVSYKEKCLFGLSYYNFCCLDFTAGLNLFNHLGLIVNVGIPLKTELKQISNISTTDIGISYKL